MKREPVNRMDLRTTSGGGSAMGSVVIVTGTGNADKLDGYDTSLTGTPWTIPVLDENGHLPAAMLPGGSEAVAGAAGVQYIGPTTRLAAALSASDSYVETTERMFGAGNETLVLSRYGQEPEQARLLGEAQQLGAARWRYAVSRAANGTKAQAWAKGTSVISLGRPNGGGYVVINSASTTDDTGRGLDGSPPYIAAYENSDGAGVWRAQFGRLKGVPQAFKDLFTAPYRPAEDIDWDTFGLAGENVFISGGIYAQYGNIAGNLDVTGQLTVYDTNSPARVSFGQTAAGFGMSLQDQMRRPIWTLAAAYFDEEADTYDSDTVWVVESGGKRVINLWRDKDADLWRLDVGPFLFADYGFYSRALNDVGASRCIIHPEVLYQFGILAVYDNLGISPGYKVIIDGTTEIAGDLAHTGGNFGTFGSLAGQQFLQAEADDLDSVIALANSIRSALVNYGLGYV